MTMTLDASVLSTADHEAIDRIARIMVDRNPVGVAISGGVDSSVLLALCAHVLRPRDVLGVLGVSPSLAAADRLMAHDVARHVGVSTIEVATLEGERAAYRRNGPDRCFQCRDELFSVVSQDVVERFGLRTVVYGEITDDRRRLDRPGARAATAHGVLSPLADAGLDKAAIRRLATAFRLPSADRPSSPCLASRIPHFTEVTPAKLRQIEVAESILHALGLRELRIRHHGDTARVEAPWAVWQAMSEETRRNVHDGVRSAGFAYVAADLGGLRLGSFTLSLLSRDERVGTDHEAPA